MLNNDFNEIIVIKILFLSALTYIFSFFELLCILFISASGRRSF